MSTSWSKGRPTRSRSALKDLPTVQHDVITGCQCYASGYTWSYNLKQSFVCMQLACQMSGSLEMCWDADCLWVHPTAAVCVLQNTVFHSYTLIALAYKESELLCRCRVGYNLIESCRCSLGSLQVSQRCWRKASGATTQTRHHQGRLLCLRVRLLQCEQQECKSLNTQPPWVALTAAIRGLFMQNHW